jgi:hypothetical protein
MAFSDVARVASGLRREGAPDWWRGVCEAVWQPGR